MSRRNLNDPYSKFCEWLGAWMAIIISIMACIACLIVAIKSLFEVAIEYPLIIISIIVLYVILKKFKIIK